ncbi:MAG: aminotransferase class V-fold PLP-dependent enzyme [Solirubrobacterales bacterium]|nr:aminotransferase class V-fold PLP-dependent enzyme [Solirubrobacterales bacterium]
MEALERHWEHVADLPVAPRAGYEELEARVRAFDFEKPVSLQALIDTSTELLRDGIVHTSHPRYFGLFNPTPTFAGVLADLLVAAFNPQLAVTSHAPAAVAIERHVLSFLAGHLGIADASGSFTSGGAEANLTAVLVALERRFPEAAADGLRAVAAQPTLYASTEAHDSLAKIVQMAGLGRGAVRLVAPTERLALDLDALRTAILRDRAAGATPFLVVATAGCTAAGVIDPLPAIAEMCKEFDIDLHVDAAWAGAACLSARLRPLLAGVERADSVTVDAHKWLSAPMGAGIFLTRHPDALGRAFRTTASYMPSAEPADPYLTSAQWSRRFIGLKVFLSLAAAGRGGYAAQLERDCELGDRLRSRLRRDGWRIVNETPLPVVCFIPNHNDSRATLASIAQHVVSSGIAWISVAQLAGRPALRACITSYRTTEQDIDLLCAELAAGRRAA